MIDLFPHSWASDYKDAHLTIDLFRGFVVQERLDSVVDPSLPLVESVDCTGKVMVSLLCLVNGSLFSSVSSGGMKSATCCYCCFFICAVVLSMMVVASLNCCLVAFLLL